VQIIILGRSSSESETSTRTFCITVAGGAGGTGI